MRKFLKSRIACSNSSLKSRYVGPFYNILQFSSLMHSTAKVIMKSHRNFDEPTIYKIYKTLYVVQTWIQKGFDHIIKFVLVCISRMIPVGSDFPEEGYKIR